MGTEDNPDVTIQWYNAPNWINLIDYASDWKTDDGGISQIPTLTLNLFNPASVPTKYAFVRIFVDVRGVQDLVFYGRVADLKRTLLAGTTKTVYTITAYDVGERLQADTISWAYFDEQSAYAPNTKWTFKSMIEDFLALPDSAYPTNITLDTDAGNILNVVSGDVNFERQTLQEALKIISELVAYDGYIWLDGSTVKLKFVGLGTLVASPATTLNPPFLQQPYLDDGIENVRNCIFVWGGKELGYPADLDKFTEISIGKYPNPNEIWYPRASETLSDEATIVYDGNEWMGTRKSYYSIKAAKASSDIQIYLAIDKTGVSSLNLSSIYQKILLFLYPQTSSGTPTIDAYFQLRDPSGNVLQKGIRGDYWDVDVKRG